MFKLFIFFVISNFLIYYSRKTLYIPGVTVNTAKNEQYYGLPNEIPALSSIFEKIKIINPSKYEAIQSLSNIIGLFPLSEQYALYKSLIKNINDNKLFNENEYKKFMEEQKFFNKQTESLNNYTTEEENRKILSLGAIKKVMAKFGFNSLDDKNITIKIENNINEILNAQILLDNCENDFLNNIFDIFFKRRDFLFDIDMTNYNINDGNEKFIRDENKNYTIKGFNYEKPQAENIIEYFKNFSFCHHLYNNILNYNAILSQLYIGQLDKCSNEDEINEYAGNSSNKVPYDEIFKGDNKIGVNVYDNVRYDSKTLNNYFLNYGFGLGTTFKKIDKTDNNYRFNISNLWENEFNKIIKEIDEINTIDIENEFEDLLNFLKNEISSYEYIPFVNLARYIIDTTFANDGSKIKLDKIFLQGYEENKTVDNKYNKKYILISENNKNLSDFFGEEVILNEYASKKDFAFESYKIFFYITNSNKILMIAKGQYNNKNYFDLYLEGESYATFFYNKTTACFAAFSSLGKNDKDACRGVLTKKCGRELDYRCKESGFYDVILQNPVSDNILPQNCLEIKNDTEYNNNACLKWLEVYLIKNGLIIKPSALGSFSLLMQSSSRGYDSQSTRLMSIFGDNEDPIKDSLTIVPQISFEFTKFKIQNINDKTTSINHLMSQVDKTFYLQLDHSINIKFSYIFLLLILFLFN